MSSQPPAPYTYSPDGRWYWDGRQWQPVAGTAPASRPPYAPPEGRATAAAAMVGLASAGAVLFFAGESLDLAAALFAGPGSAVEVAGALVLLLGEVVFVIGLVGGAVSVPMWMHRAYRNLPSLGAEGLRWSPAWAAGAWFIPLANLVLPYLIAAELWRRADGGQRPLSALLPIWWAAWILAYVSQLAANQAGRFSRAAGDALGLLNDLGLVLAGVLLVLIIQRVTRRQRDRYAGLQRA